MPTGLAKKLNLKPDMKLRVIGKPANVSLGDVVTTTSPKSISAQCPCGMPSTPRQRTPWFVRRSRSMPWAIAFTCRSLRPLITTT